MNPDDQERREKKEGFISEALETGAEVVSGIADLGGLAMEAAGGAAEAVGGAAGEAMSGCAGCLPVILVAIALPMVAIASHLLA